MTVIQSTLQLTDETLLRIGDMLNDQHAPFTMPPHGYRLCGDVTRRIVRVRPAKKYSSAHFMVELTYSKVEKHVTKPRFKGWEDRPDKAPATLHSPEFVLIARDDIRQKFLEVIHAMIHVFHANVLLLKNYTGDRMTRKEFRDVLRSNNIYLIFTDELASNSSFFK